MKRNIYYVAITITLLLLVMELTYINSKSLLYLVSDFATTDRLFAVIGAMAFSMVTVLVMRTTPSFWMRLIFPLFDALLVFCGFNLKFAGNLKANPVAFYLTIFYALFVFVIMYGLGKISYEREVGTNPLKAGHESNRINDETNQKLAESNRINDDLTQKLAESNRISSELQQKAEGYGRIAEEFLRNHVLYEAWMSKKRSEANRNGYDKLVGQMAVRIKQGEKITLSEWLQEAHR